MLPLVIPHYKTRVSKPFTSANQQCNVTWFGGQYGYCTLSPKAWNLTKPFKSFWHRFKSHNRLEYHRFVNVASKVVVFLSPPLPPEILEGRRRNTSPPLGLMERTALTVILEFSVLNACPSSLGRGVCFALSHFSPKLETTTTTVGCGCLLTINRTICGIGFSSFWSQLYIFSIKPGKAKLHTSLSGIKYTLKKLIHCSFICGMISFTIQVDSSTSSTCRNLNLDSASCWRENYISHNISGTG